MYTRNGVETYRNTDAHTMTREKLIVLLYEKIVSNLHEAEAAAENDNRLGMTQALNHSQRIISELRNALDHEIGGDISRNLESLYDYLFHEHLEMLVDREIIHTRNCLRVITPLLEAWRSIPVGTGDQAARDHAKGQLVGQVGPEPATEGQPVDASDPQTRTMSELVSVSA